MHGTKATSPATSTASKIRPTLSLLPTRSSAASPACSTSTSATTPPEPPWGPSASPTSRSTRSMRTSPSSPENIVSNGAKKRAAMQKASSLSPSRTQTTAGRSSSTTLPDPVANDDAMPVAIVLVRSNSQRFLMTFHITLETAEDGWIVAESRALPGCVSQGKDEEEAINNIREAITAWMWAEDQKAIKSL